MKINAFIQDSNRIIYALYEIEGIKGSSIIWYQGAHSYIRTGSAQNKNRRYHVFTDGQEAALNAFIGSPATITTYTPGIS